MEEPQIVRVATARPTPTLAVAKARNCPDTVLNLPAGGILSLPNGDIITLTGAAAFKPTCAPIAPPAIIANGGGGSVTIGETSNGSAAPDTTPQFSDFMDPFYASTFPQCYALASTTVIAYTLVIMLFITPRSFLDGGVVVLGRRGFTNGASGTNIGGRPWLQKVAALTVAISLTIATSETFRVAELQYSWGIQNASMLQQDVLGGTELKVIRIISDTFLWLAQAQTLIRLFPRQREKIIIKWTAFSLITLDVIFQSLNSFQYTDQGATRPKTFTDAVPALSYLFELSLGVLYAAWVIYYSLMKKRYAFYHPQMKNICLVAVLSLLAILVPVVFFILDISKPAFTGWGDYVRWVGAAAASVIVWEWVERIEALEREEKKDGILGREVFDGDEMLEMMTWPKRKKKVLDDSDQESAKSRREGRGPRDDRGAATGRGNIWPSVTSIATKYRSRSRPRHGNNPAEPSNTQSSNNDRIRFLQPPLWPARPPPAVTPVSRTDTASAASTMYAVRYHPLTETTSRTTPPPPQDHAPLTRSNSAASSHHSDGGSTSSAAPEQQATQGTTPTAQEANTSSGTRWRALAQGISLPRIGGRSLPTHERRSPPHEERKVQRDEDSSRWDIRSRLEEFAVTQAEKLRERIRPTPDTGSLPVTVIPAPPRRGAALAQLREEEEQELEAEQGRDQLHRTSSSASRTSRAAVGEAPQLRRLNTTGSAPLRQPRPSPHPQVVIHGAEPSRTPTPRGGMQRSLTTTVVPAPPRQAQPEPPNVRGPSRVSLGKQVGADEGGSHDGSRA
ncbi:PalH/RIM21-domain-containing protein [Diplogelasinospora grovesii]|uniref:PalH/RIM21-domain-containing protein n=1 Tax=Diplogelasinospora grovesii TaxID=303347 RepID=A0AAN6NID1_9PEZI|nr:PalH/RIM21-domain-containing protein [Diplogelasinospora grovesii]